ncbi:5-formyltetrahydrofolate cyclo-ligase [Acinetobacter pseudolwoffii]|uniref:5-formyltetrahydrofolate cyclo-ligase n=1 Tax=Acinetobacter pseudolwoffii TaxID=2053287 RepID=UPI0025772FD3|nr:5-formyltetrahydrofolate cyclo-ligase [Acinetobacter pseudolwoffii]MDM1343961.1 5-formyltetrahydrofolate cyclo-ligase [Acinetobacter pseudolwoffii]
MTIQELRRYLRKTRRHLSKFEQRQAAQKVLNRLIRSPQFIHAKHIGIYLHAFGEIHTHTIIEHCFKLGKQVYLPAICDMNQQLVWIRISQHQYRNKRFAYHRLGMRESMTTRGTHVSKLDLLIMPLLACDHSGTRIGMGGGFYDRTLASAPGRPFRLGLAHDFQLLSQPLKREKWDQPLDALITPTVFLAFKR